jgi:hypothetical protein
LSADSLPLRRSFSGHEVITAWHRGWSELSNGELLAAAETDGFELLITTDQIWLKEQTQNDPILLITSADLKMENVIRITLFSTVLNSLPGRGTNNAESKHAIANQTN